MRILALPPPPVVLAVFCGVQPALAPHGWGGTVAGKYIVFGTALKAFAGYKPQLFNVRENPHPLTIIRWRTLFPVCSLTRHAENLEAHSSWRKRVRPRHPR